MHQGLARLQDVQHVARRRPARKLVFAGLQPLGGAGQPHARLEHESGAQQAMAFEETPDGRHPGRPSAPPRWPDRRAARAVEQLKQDAAAESAGDGNQRDQPRCRAVGATPPCRPQLTAENTSDALVPPKPKELDSAGRTLRSLAL